MLPAVVLPPPAAHKATVIWLHGLGDSGHGFAPLMARLPLPPEHGLRFVLPHAPSRPLSLNGGLEMPAWYDLHDSADFSRRADKGQLAEAVQQIHAMLDAERRLGIGSQQIILGGFSQGGVVALQAGLSYDRPLAGIALLSCYLGDEDWLASHRRSANRATPIWLSHGREDEVVPLAAGEALYRRLCQWQQPVSWQVYAMGHEVCPEQWQALGQWLYQQSGS